MRVDEDASKYKRAMQLNAMQGAGQCDGRQYRAGGAIHFLIASSHCTRAILHLTINFDSRIASFRY